MAFDGEDKLVELERESDPSARSATCRGIVEATLSSIHSDEPEEQILQRLARIYDGLIAALYRGARVPSSALISLVALGGYGRGELFPHSDLDLLILYEGGEDELSTGVVERVVYPLWDAGLSVGHAVRGIEETLDLAAQDLTMRTSLLDLRLICGDEGPYHALQAGALREFFGPQKVKDFVNDLLEERSGRHKRFGATEYLLEPNVKNSKGGLRDLNTGLWAAKARFDVVELGQLVPIGAITVRQLKALEEAHTFLRKLRVEMHLQAKRAQDHLLFELQERLAPVLCPDLEVPGVQRRTGSVEPAVERLMHAFYRHARAVVLETDGILERCSIGEGRSSHGGRPLTSRPDEHFVELDRRIRSSDPQRFWDTPSEIVRAFSVGLDRRLDLDRTTQDTIAEAVADEPGRQLAADEEAARLWMELLCHSEQPKEGTVLEEMHHLGVISAIIPEFEPCTGRIQHDLYHVYTVDLHSLYVVALLKAWRRGELSGQHPTPVAVMSRVVEVESLMLAALLHDVAKPLGRGHAAKGARLAAGVAARLGLQPRQQEEVRLLVEQHLTMAHVSQRRDLSDPSTIATFGERVSSIDRLRRLYLLTVADTAMTAPGNLSSWKATLLDELFMKTYRHLRDGRGDARQRRRQELSDAGDALELALYRGWGEQGRALSARVPEEMLLGLPVEDLAFHLGVLLELESIPEASLRLRTRKAAGGATELTVCCPDSPGTLAAITGVMLAHGIEVLAAQVFTLEAPEKDETAHVLDIFVVETARATSDEKEVWGAFHQDLEDALRGDLCVAGLVDRHTRSSGLPPKVTPRVSIEVSVDNEASDRYSVVDVQAPDLLGALHAITRSMSEQEVVIHLSKVASEAGRVIDIFYVSDSTTGGKVLDEERLVQLRRSVTSAIEDLMPGKRG